MEKATENQIELWKKAHGDIFKFDVDGKTAYLKKPSRKVLSYASGVATTDPMKFNELILNDCWLAGDEEIKTDDSLFLAASSKMAQLIEVKEAELVKL